jgi:hypothetical protein
MSSVNKHLPDELLKKMTRRLKLNLRSVGDHSPHELTIRTSPPLYYYSIIYTLRAPVSSLILILILNTLTHAQNCSNHRYLTPLWSPNSPSTLRERGNLVKIRVMLFNHIYESAVL